VYVRPHVPSTKQLNGLYEISYQELHIWRQQAEFHCGWYDSSLGCILYETQIELYFFPQNRPIVQEN
jgi:hypothetical protein